MLGIIKCDNRYEYLSTHIESIISNNLTELYNIDELLLPFSGIDDNYNIKSTKLNLLDILDNNDIKIIFVGTANVKLKELCIEKNINLVELLKDEDFVIENAKLTSLGVIHHLSRADKIINDYKVIITGFGYLGYTLAEILKTNGVDFSIYSSNNLEKKYIKLMGYKFADFNDFSIIINTIPHNIDIDYSLLLNKRILDIASEPYGFDILKINDINVRYEILGSIPAKFCPNLAGNIIKKCIEKYRNLIYN